jgi:hypothetical protein
VICEMSRGSNPRPVDQAVDVSNVLTMLWFKVFNFSWILKT